MKKLLILIIVATLFVSCFLTNNEPNIVVDAQLATSLLEVAEDTLTQCGSIIMNVEIWRNMMPGSDNSSMSVTSELLSLDSIGNLYNIELLEQYVIKNDTIWTSWHNDPITNSNISEVYVTFDGPEWRISDTVDVVSQGLDHLCGYTFKIKKENVVIQGAY